VEKGEKGKLKIKIKIQNMSIPTSEVSAKQEEVTKMTNQFIPRH
jgi:hypothetical protein